MIVGDNCVVGNSCELKNALLFNDCQVPHFNYVGDSILGHKAHLGAGVRFPTSNSLPGNVTVEMDGEPFDTGLRKFGALLGDGAEVGCNSVLNPGSIIGRGAVIYPCTNWRGILPANMIAKNKAPVEVVVGCRDFSAECDTLIRPVDTLTSIGAHLLTMICIIERSACRDRSRPGRAGGGDFLADGHSFAGAATSSFARNSSRWPWPWRGRCRMASIWLVEAGTGVGKASAIWSRRFLFAVAQRKKAVISHAHDQSAGATHRKRPADARAQVLPVKFSFTMLKGRGNYLCTRRLHKAMQQAGNLFTSPEVEELQRIYEWSQGDEGRQPVRLRDRARPESLGAGLFRTRAFVRRKSAATSPTSRRTIGSAFFSARATASCRRTCWC